MLNKIREASTNFTIPLSFILPISMLYLSKPSSFELVWKGRAPYLIFLWLLFLELALVWKKLPNKPLSITAIAITTAAPTYLIGILAFALNDKILELGKLAGAPYLEHGQWILESWALSIEYVALTICLVACILLLYKIEGLKFFPISMFFIGATSCFYMIDTFYPFGTFAVLQAFAPVTASFAIHVLNWIGYEAHISGFYEGMPILYVVGLPGPSPVIGWPCAGVQSLFIYTFVILLFLRGTAISTLRKAFYVIIGAIGTFIVNVLRIVSYCVIGVNAGVEARDIFHKYYGELYFIAWIIAYLLVVVYGGRILTRLSALAFKLKDALISYKGEQTRN